MSMLQYFTAKQAFNMIIVIILQGLLFQTNAAITSVSAASGRNYQVATLQIGAVQYIDRNFTFTNIDNFGGSEYIRTANNDKYSTGSTFLTFTITQPGLVCVAHDDRIAQKPSWLSQFTMSNADLVTTDGHPLSIYTRYVEAGTVVLGGNLAGSSGSNISMYSVVVVEQTRPTISDIEVANGRTYRISTVALGEEQYVDRDYVFTQIGSLGGRQFIQAYNNDKFTVSDSFLSFTLDMAAVVYVAHDDRITVKPDWLLTFTDIGVNILSSDGNYPMSVFQKVFPAGRVTLGGNAQTTPPNKFISMYTVIVGDAYEPITFSRTYGLDNWNTGDAVQQTADGGYIIGCSTGGGDPSWYCKIYLIRTTAQGDTLWTKLYNEYPSQCGTNDLKKTSDGGYIITGFYDEDIFLLKVDSSGNEIWRKTFGGDMTDYGFSVQQTFDGGYIIGGVTSSFGAGDYDMYLIRTDGNGNVLWTKTFGNADTDWGNATLQTNDSGFIIAGYNTTSPNDAHDIYVVKTNENGDTVWTVTYGTAATNDIANSIQKTTDGGYIIAGFGWDAALYLLKIDGNGNELWHKNLSYSDTTTIEKAIQTNDGGYIAICGLGLTIYKTDSSGDTVWTKRYNGEGTSIGHSILQTSDDGYIVSGSTGPDDDWANKVYLLKIDTSGNLKQ